MNDKKKILNAIIERNKLQDFVRDNLDLIHQMMLARLGKPYSKMGVQNGELLGIEMPSIQREACASLTGVGPYYKYCCRG